MTDKTFRLVRDVPIEDQYDLLVAGGGPAGSAAAICAARLGLRVLLVEQTGCLGGMGTSGLVSTFGPMSDGVRPLVGGFARELIETMYARGLLGPDVTPEYWTAMLNRWIPFKPEGLKRMLDDFCEEAGVEVRFFTEVIDADADGHTVKGAIISNMEGYRYIAARTFIDATGDADLAALCGADCVVAGRDTPDIAPATLCSFFAGVNWDDPAIGNDLDGWKLRARNEWLPQAIADGHFSQEDRFMPGMNKVGMKGSTLNGGHVFGLDALNCRSMSDGMVTGRRLALEYLDFFRKYVPGCGELEHLTTAPLMGVRDSRRIVGEFNLGIDDFLARRQFPDQIAVYNRPTDVHPTNTSKEEYERFLRDFEGIGRLGKGDFVGIPYSILVPKDWNNLWVAGRCHSSDTKVHGSIRAQSAAYMMGQGAATAACQSVATGQPACELDTAALVTTLRNNGAFLPQTALSATMTR